MPDAAILLVNVELRLRLVARACAPGDPPVRHSRDVGESFSEIFFGNSVALGMPCVTADAADDGRADGSRWNRDPATDLSVDLDQMRSRREAPRYAVRLPRPHASRSWTAAGTRPACCWIDSRMSKPWRAACHM